MIRSAELAYPGFESLSLGISRKRKPRYRVKVRAAGSISATVSRISPTDTRDIRVKKNSRNQMILSTCVHSPS